MKIRTSARGCLRATDEFGRTVTFTQNQQWAIPLSAPNTELYASAGGTVSVVAPTVTGKRGNLTFTKISGPDYLAVGTTGAVSGTIPSNPSLPQTVTIRMRDDWDGRTADFSVTLKAPDAARYWRAQSQSGGASRFYEIVPLTSDGSSPIAISGLTAAADANDATFANSNGYIVYDFGKPVDVPAFTITTSVASGGNMYGSQDHPGTEVRQWQHMGNSGKIPVYDPRGMQQHQVHSHNDAVLKSAGLFVDVSE